MIVNALLVILIVLVVGIWVDWRTERRHQQDLEHYIDPRE